MFPFFCDVLLVVILEKFMASYVLCCWRLVLLLGFAFVAAGYVLVLPSSSTFNQDVAEWNGANYSSAAGMPLRIYFVYSTGDALRAVEDVLQCSNLSLVVRSGRHQYTGFGVVGPLRSLSFAVIDVSNITGMLVVPGSGNTLSVGAGERQYMVYQFAWANGLLLPGGTCPTVGISGFVLGGGYGFFGRKYSVAADALVEAEVVSIDKSGHAFAANATEGSQLLWGLRGGGNNAFGIVTRLVLRLPSAPQLYSRVRIEFSMSYCVTRVAALYDSVAPYASPDLYVQLVVYTNACAIVAAAEGDAHALNDSLNLSQWLSIPTAATTGVNTTGYDTFVTTLAGCDTALQCVTRCASAFPDPRHPDFFGAFSIYVEKPLGSAGMQLLFNGMAEKPPALGFVFTEFDPYGPTGAVNQKGSNFTAFPHRTALYHIQFLAYWASANMTAIANSWLAAVFASLAPYGSGSYRNYPSSWLPSASYRFYKDNLQRLSSLRKKVDPLNRFHCQLLGS